jgi:hypothetical protein
MIDRDSAQQKEVFEMVWDHGNYRQGSPGLRIVPRFLQYARGGGYVINDYGSGTGRAAVALFNQGFLVNMVDIAENALEDEARALVGRGLTFTLASLWDLPADFPHAPWGYCMEVLMTIPEPRMDATLGHIARTCRNLFVQVYHRKDPRAGHECNLVQWDRERWGEELARYFAQVETIDSHEIATRYLYVCRESLR